jgi:uncharacterized protein YgiM (DUF1202 family)
LLVRTAPDSGSDVIGLLLVDEVVPIVARNADLTWWQINDNGKIGWVNGVYVTLSPTLNAVAIPVAP